MSNRDDPLEDRLVMLCSLKCVIFGRMDSGENTHTNGSPIEPQSSKKDDIYTQVRVDGHIKAKSSLKTATRGLFWYESFDILDTPPLASYLTLQVRRHEPHDDTFDSPAIISRSRESSSGLTRTLRTASVPGLCLHKTFPSSMGLRDV